jgi:hypothetical protein
MNICFQAVNNSTGLSQRRTDSWVAPSEKLSGEARPLWFESLPKNGPKLLRESAK